MSQYLIDSDWIIEALKGHERTMRILEELASDGLFIPAIAYGEVYQGAYYSQDPVDSLLGLRSFIDGIPILGATASIAERFAVIRGSLTPHFRQQIGDLDLFIAATALEHGLVLLTNNIKHFIHVPGLTVFSESEQQAGD